MVLKCMFNYGWFIEIDVKFGSPEVWQGIIYPLLLREKLFTVHYGNNVGENLFWFIGENKYFNPQRIMCNV